MALSAGTRLGPYEILSPLGAGGMGEVYKARDSRLDRRVALKVLPQVFASDPDRMARFDREARLLASLNHPHIASLYGVEEFGLTRALVMELVEGPTLASRLATGALPLEESLLIARQIAEALEYAHNHAIIHRDLKPANVKVAPDRTVKILDFGLAKALDDEPVSYDARSSPTMSMAATQAGVILGTAAYMSPEQAKGKTVDRRSDIWTFGVVLFEMITGKPLYTGETAAEIMASVMKELPRFDHLPSATPMAVRILLRRCLEKDPNRRLRDIGEARLLLEETQSAELPTRSPSRVIGWIAAAVLLLAFGALAFVHFGATPPPTPGLRLSIALPEKCRINGFALSPDGRYLAIATVGAKNQLWLRPLNSQVFQALSGTEGANAPFWSPDGRRIGFLAQGKLKVIPAGGGPAQVFCEASIGGGGAWNRDDLILFSRGGALHRVPATGGESKPVTKPTGGSIHVYPVFLPDGRHFLYLVRSGDESKAGVYVASFDDPTGRRILVDQSGVAFVPPRSGSRQGHLLFVRESTLMAQPFDPQTLQLAGDVSLVASQASFGGGGFGGSGASASSNGVLVYVSGSRFGGQLTWFDRAGKQLGTVGSSDMVGEIALSPDEKTLAFKRLSPQSLRTDLWLHELTRGVETRLTFPPTSTNDAPIWSPDGGRIIFSSRLTISDLYWKDTRGGEAEPLVRNDNAKFASDCSRDGRFLVYTESDPKTKADIWILEDPWANRGHHKPVPFLRTEFDESQGQISPNGRWIAYTSDESGQFEVYVRPFPAGNGTWRISSNGGRDPRWRRDGEELFYMSSDSKLMAVAIQTEVASPQGPVIKAASAKPLFDVRPNQMYVQLNLFPYSVASGGQRFLINTLPETAAPTMNVIVNWENAIKGTM
jgi:serine/threonine protein kinase/Tol biopolymer transport system component